jgi:hypothetical protein
VSRKALLAFVMIAACSRGAAVSDQTPGPAATPAQVAAAPAQQVAPTRPAGAVWPDEGPRTWAPRATEGAITANDLRTRLYQIADDSMMGRRAASLGDWKATAYVASEFQRLGLRPAGDGGTFFQEIEFGPLRFDRAQVRLVAAGRTLEPGRDWAPMMPGEIPIPGVRTAVRRDFQADGMSAVFAGRWGDTLVALDPAAFRGNVAVFLARPPAPAGTGRGGGGGAVPAVVDMRAQRAGAAALLIVFDTLPTNVVNAAFNARTMLMPFMTVQTAGASITAAAAAALFNQPLAQLAPGTRGGAISGRWAYLYQRPQYPARNVIAVLPGSDPTLSAEYVLVGAHNDHDGLLDSPVDHDSLRAFNRVMRPQGANDRPGPPTAAQQRQIDSLIAYARTVRPPRRDSVMNGADDDGSGTAVLLEIAERFATGQAPRRSIVFISHAAEEEGLLGSEYFTDHPTIPREAIVAAHNMDMVGNGGVSDVRFGGPAQVQMLGARRLSAEFGDAIDSLNAVRAETMAIDYSWDRTNALNRFCRSDQVSYFRYDIPVTYFSTGYSLDYHQATDEPQYIDYDKSARVGRFVHEIMNTMANRATRPALLPPNQRDLSANC